jgi:hypothetical protein
MDDLLYWLPGDDDTLRIRLGAALPRKERLEEKTCPT